MGELVNFPKQKLSRDELHRLAAEAEIQVEDAQRALDVAKGIRMYYLRLLGMVAFESGEKES